MRCCMALRTFPAPKQRWWCCARRQRRHGTPTQQPSYVAAAAPRPATSVAAGQLTCPCRAPHGGSRGDGKPCGRDNSGSRGRRAVCRVRDSSSGRLHCAARRGLPCLCAGPERRKNEPAAPAREQQNRWRSPGPRKVVDGHRTSC
jgi:hypothetical protein